MIDMNIICELIERRLKSALPLETRTVYIMTP